MALRKIALLGAAASFALAAPAAAQMNMNMPGMHMPGMKMPAPKKKKKAAAKKPAPSKKGTAAKKGSKAKTSKKASAKKPAAKSHKEHDMGSMPGMQMPGHDMSTMPGMSSPTNPSAPAGHDMSTMPGMQMPQGQAMPNMPGMAMPGMEAPSGTDLPAGNAPPPPLPTDHAADQVYGSEAMAMGRHHLERFHGGQKVGQVFFNLAEYQFRKGRDGYEWNGEAWYGGDINRVWLKSEGEGTFGRSVERAELQALYSHAIGPYFNLQGGLRYDFKPNPSRVYATLGIEGLAPSFFEVEGALFLSNKGELLARAEGYYDQRITQRLILQPRAELNFAAQSSRETGVGSGLSDAELGLRLRYDITRQFAPYVGVQYRSAFGATRRFLRDAGEDSGGWEVVTGIHTWF
ncbi:MAG: copper resistance protein B [Bacillota bacterium]